MEERGLRVIPFNFVVKQDFIVSGGCLWKFRDQLLQLFVFTGTAKDFLLHPVHSSLLRLGRTAVQPFLALQLCGSNFFKCS